MDEKIKFVTGFVKSEGKLRTGVKRTYDGKKKVNPGMPDYDTWLKETYAQGVVAEVEFMGQWDEETAKDVMLMEYAGAWDVILAAKHVGARDWMSYVSEGQVHGRIDVKYEDTAEKVKTELEAAGWACEIVREHDDAWIPISCEKKFEKGMTRPKHPPRG